MFALGIFSSIGSLVDSGEAYLSRPGQRSLDRNHHNPSFLWISSSLHALHFFNCKVRGLGLNSGMRHCIATYIKSAPYPFYIDAHKVSSRRLVRDLGALTLRVDVASVPSSSLPNVAEPIQIAKDTRMWRCAVVDPDIEMARIHLNAACEDSEAMPRPVASNYMGVALI